LAVRASAVSLRNGTACAETCVARMATAATTARRKKEEACMEESLVRNPSHDSSAKGQALPVAQVDDRRLA
jgi:hypothetical protein